MEKRQLLLITKNSNLLQKITNEAGAAYDTTSVKNVHAGYSLALSYLPDLILIDHPSLGPADLKNLKNFKSTHFLNKSFLFVLGDEKVNESKLKDHVDGVVVNKQNRPVLRQIEENIQLKKCLTNYWKDSFMGLFNLLDHPILLLQDDDIVAVNDAFKKDFFITGKVELNICDLVQETQKTRLRQILRKFSKGKHMKACTRTILNVNGKIREADITFSKVDKSLSGQLILMINFSGKESPLTRKIGTTSLETENFFSAESEQQEKCFTKREKEIISLLCKGYKTKEISELLCISAKTIEKHRANIVKRTHSGTILESIVYALNHNLVEI